MQILDRCVSLTVDQDTFAGAQARCAAVGGTLPEPDSREETRSLARLSVLNRTRNGDARFWIGLNDAVVEGSFAYQSDNRPVVTDFFGGVEPNGPELVNCLCAEGNHWTDEACDSSQFIACETVTTTEAPRCGDGVVDIGDECDDGNTIDGDGCEGNCTLLCGAPDALLAFQLSDRCVAAFDEQLAFTSALSACTGRSMDPALFSTEQDARDAAPPLLTGQGELWVGFTDDGLIVPGAIEGSARWAADSSQPVFDVNPLFSPGEPNGATAENCFEVGTSGWNDRSCFGHQNASLCTTPVP